MQRAIPKKRLSVVGVGLLLFLAACGSGGGSAPSNHGPLTVAVLLPFTGPNAVFGPTQLGPCRTATGIINQSGGVLGHKLTCQGFDTKGDPADAVPATEQMFASTPNLVMVIGGSSDEANAVVPIVDKHKMVIVSGAGNSEFNKSSFQYFYRLIAPDDAAGFAMAYAAVKLDGYKRIALVFGTDTGTQSYVGPATKGVQELGGSIAINQALDPSATSYKTEVTQLLAAKPDVILSEVTPTADATYFKELKQLNNGTMLPVIGTINFTYSDWISAVKGAIGVTDLQRLVQAVSVPLVPTGSAYDAATNYAKVIQKQIAGYPDALGFSTFYTFYDFVIMAALAMNQTNSIIPSVYNAAIVPIANGVPGAVDVATYAEGVAALKAGKKIHYVGAEGIINFNQYHNSSSGFQIFNYDTTGKSNISGAHITEAEISQLEIG
jgi:ABC-type branched-subunit amino acid transport system substrate-binding protein